ncbi:HK97 family phage prohead protease [Mycobacterium kansasii]|uniref:HK97 family phage prohead protease n=1 Tax=Mycobacterium kansasii TaxID=1768 RepID=UPI000F022F31|nr:HK97 family phage prohead protease [Mycobacterium kansasii]VAZ65318.1 hypothetical protein LAUMK40_01443 [Mycobacterium kansasii]
MTTETELPPWAAKLPDWVRPDEFRWLARRPWIAGFIRPDDYSLEPAEARFERAQRDIRRQYGFAAGHQPELVALRGGMETTALRFSTGTSNLGIVRGVSVQTSSPGHVSGIAVPFGKPSTPVVVAGDVACIEQFDAESFAPLPPSCPLRVDHDPASSLGRVVDIRRKAEGLAIKARIDTADRQLWAMRWLRGEWSSLSIGFAGSPAFDDWSSTPQGWPLRTVRGARLVEVSVVKQPAYPSARILEVTGP